MIKRRVLLWASLGVVLVAAGLGSYYYVSSQKKVPPGIAFGNGRIEADQIAIATKYAGRIAQLDFKEGDLVKAGQVLARMDTSELEASERAAAGVVAQRSQDADAARSQIEVRASELNLANSELKRGQILVAKDAISRQRVEQLTAAQRSAEERLAAAKSQASAADAAVVAAKNEQQRYQAMIADSTLVAPKLGRILYRPANIGETLPAGGQVATMVDLSEVYMTFFLPSTTAAKLSMGAQARIVLDAIPERPIPAFVSFISPLAQFTPKQVETQTERERMMFRIKIRIPVSLVMQYLDKVKTGVTGVAYVRVDPNAQWPSWLQSDLTATAESK